MSEKKEKTAFSVLAEAMATGQLGNVKPDLSSLKSRKLSIDEIKDLIKEAFEDAKDVSNVKAKELEKGWGDTAIENEIDWMKKLGIKEFFVKKNKESVEK